MNRIKLLLVEDNQADAQMAERILSKNHLVASFVRLQDGEAAMLYLMNEHNPVPTLILLDIKMPKITGLELLQIIRRESRTCMIPTIMLSSSARTEDIQEAYRLGANGYFVKPGQLKVLQQTLDGLVNYWSTVNHPAL
ncbi:MAG: response regulator [Phaeodactylibacter sp.]|nr:response regulator [Phaeodactylibacter sp.]